MWVDAASTKSFRQGFETQQEAIEREPDIEAVADRHLGRLSVRRTGWLRAERSL
jgi:hypothetical protein